MGMPWLCKVFRENTGVPIGGEDDFPRKPLAAQTLLSQQRHALTLPVEWRDGLRSEIGAKVC